MICKRTLARQAFPLRPGSNATRFQELRSADNASARPAFSVPLVLLPELLNLFEVMAPMDPMEYSPLARGQGSEGGMIEHSRSFSEAVFALRNHLVHG